MSFANEYIKYNQGDQDQVIPLTVDVFDTHRSLLGFIDHQTELLAWGSQVDRDPEVVVYFLRGSAYHEAEWAEVPIEWSFGNSVIRPHIAALTSVGATVGHGWSLAPTRYSFSLDEALHELEDIHEEVEETYAVADDVKAIPASAYEDARFLLKQMHHNLPMPDIMWSEDGGIGLEWRPGNGIATMSLYGDNHVIYGVFFSDKREVEGICSLSDTVLLQGFLTTLENLF